jgi:ribosome maturation factor RimP
MSIAHTKLPGLDEAKILAMVEPVLATHREDGVELVLRGERGGRVLMLTIEKPGTQRTGEGITIEICTEISRKISEAFDESDAIPGNYRLEVGSPGVERQLYLKEDYERFAGQEVKVKLNEPSTREGFIGQKTIRGTLFGLDEEGRVVLETDHGTIPLPFSEISVARLVFSWNQPKRKMGRQNSTGRRAAGSGAKPRTTKRSSENGRRQSSGDD